MGIPGTVDLQKIRGLFPVSPGCWRRLFYRAGGFPRERRRFHGQINGGGASRPVSSSHFPRSPPGGGHGVSCPAATGHAIPSGGQPRGRAPPAASSRFPRSHPAGLRVSRFLPRGIPRPGLFAPFVPPLRFPCPRFSGGRAGKTGKKGGDGLAVARGT